MIENRVFSFRHEKPLRDRRKQEPEDRRFLLVQRTRFGSGVTEYKPLGVFTQFERLELVRLLKDQHPEITFPLMERPSVENRAVWYERILSTVEEWGIGKMY